MSTSQIYKDASFFKMLLPDVPSKLRLPVSFVDKYGHILPQKAVLKTGNGKRWNVEIKKIDDHFWLMNGWPEFVTDNNLTLLDLITFKLTKESIFVVEIFGKDGTKKPSSSPSPDQGPGQMPQTFEVKRENCESSENETVGMRSFVGVVKNYTKWFMLIPKKFAISRGLARKDGVILENERGEKWEVGINIQSGGRICLTRGWSVFRQANELFVGVEFRFHFDPISGNLILDKGLETNEKCDQPVERGRGRPRGN